MTSRFAASADGIHACYREIAAWPEYAGLQALASKFSIYR